MFCAKSPLAGQTNDNIKRWLEMQEVFCGWFHLQNTSKKFTCLTFSTVRI